MMHIVGIIIAVLVGIPFLFWAAAQQDRLKKWGVPRAVEIARFQGWVSPHRLMNQAHLTKSDAQMVLIEACKQGLLYQAVNGRYYCGPPPSA